jgi:hypothetical protein
MLLFCSPILSPHTPSASISIHSPQHTKIIYMSFVHTCLFVAFRSCDDTCLHRSWHKRCKSSRQSFYLAK